MSSAVADPPLDEQQIDGGDANGSGPAVPLDEIRIDGPAQLSMFDVGGKKATTGTLRLTGGKIDLVDGKAFKKGTTVVLEVVAVVNSVGQVDKHDAETGQVVSCEQRHSARITDLRIVEKSA